MKQKLLLTLLIGLFATAGFGQRATAFEITGPHYLNYGGHNVGNLVVTVNGKKRKIADEAGFAWIIGGGNQVVYSGSDGSGGFENVGESLRIYDVRTGKTRRIFSEYFAIDGLTEVKLRSGASALLVRGDGGESESLPFAVVDPKRGEVFRLDSAELIKVRGDFITLIVGADDALDFAPGEEDHTAFAMPRPTARNKITKKYDLKKLIKRKVIENPNSDEEAQSGGMLDGWRISTRSISEKNESKRFEITAEYPEIEGVGGADVSDFNARAKEMVAGPVAKFREPLLEQTPEDIAHMMSQDNNFHVNYEIKLLDDRFISVQFMYSDYISGMMHPLFYVDNLTYDLKDRRKIDLADLFAPDSKYLEVISAYCLKELRKRPPVNRTKLAVGEWAVGAAPDAENYETWNLTSRGLLITFGFEQIAPYPAGVNYVLIPFSELKEISRPGGALTKAQ